MQKFLVADGGNLDGTAKDAITGIQPGTKYKSKVWNDNIFNLFEFVEGEGYQLIVDDLTQLQKALRGKYDSSATYNTSSIATQTVSDIVLGSNGIYYECLADATNGDDPVGSVTGNWEVKNFEYIARREQLVALNITSDADYTLTDDENSYGIIGIPSGTLTVQRNIIVSDFERNILIENNSGFTQTVKTSAGTGTDVADGLKLLLRSDGANVIEATSLNVASTAESQSQTNDTKAITPLKLAESLQGANQSLTISGYQKLPGGFIIQWGQSGLIGNNAYEDVLFPIAFPNAILTATATPYTEGDDSSDISEKISTLSLTTIRLSLDTNAGTHRINYIAIGY